jgi:hypothetical protein
MRGWYSVVWNTALHTPSASITDETDSSKSEIASL